MGSSRSSVSPGGSQRAAAAVSATADGQRRHPDVARFTNQLCEVLTDRTQGTASAQWLVRQMCLALHERSGAAGAPEPRHLPVCVHLDTALAHVRKNGPGLSDLADHLAALSPRLHWQRRADAQSDPSPFRESHANTQIIGPHGIEQRHDLVVGASLLAPHTEYPRHAHPPREVYLVLSDGQWWSEDRHWYRPGLGAIVYHRSGITHAMRSGSAPLLALWCLLPESGRV